MNVKIKKIANGGELDKERVVFSVIEDTPIGTNMVMKTKTLSEKKVSSSIEQTFWFPDKDVKKGDLVVLYTKKGINTESQNDDGTTTHFFYLGLDSPIWNDAEDAVLLVETDGNWSARSVSDGESV